MARTHPYGVSTRLQLHISIFSKLLQFNLDSMKKYPTEELHGYVFINYFMKNLL